MNKFPALLCFFISVFWLFSCGDTAPQTSNDDSTELASNDSLQIGSEKEEDQKLYSWLEDLRVREKPEKSATVVAELGVGESVTYLNEKTAFTIQVNIRGQNLDEPWLKVKTREGIEGWVFGGGLKVYEVSAPSFGASPFSKCFSRFGVAYRDCIETTRQKQLRKNKTMVSESEDGTTLKLLGGEQHQFSNSDISSFQFLQYAPEIGYYVLKEKTELTTNFLFVNDKTAKQTAFIGFPEIHPKGNFIACVSPPTSKPCKLEIHEMQKGKWVLVYELEEEESLLFNPIWSSDGDQLEYEMKPTGNQSGLAIQKTKITLKELLSK